MKLGFSLILSEIFLLNSSNPVNHLLDKNDLLVLPSILHQWSFFLPILHNPFGSPNFSSSIQPFMSSGRTLCVPSPLLGVWLLGTRHHVSTSGNVGRGFQTLQGGHGQGWSLAQRSYFQLRLLSWPHLSYNSHCPAAECLAVGATESGPSAGQHVHIKKVSDLPYHHGLTSQVIWGLIWLWWPPSGLSCFLFQGLWIQSGWWGQLSDTSVTSVKSTWFFSLHYSQSGPEISVLQQKSVFHLTEEKKCLSLSPMSAKSNCTFL